VIHRKLSPAPDCNPKIEAKVHPNACGAAIAAECARRQGRGSDYNRILFAHQEELARTPCSHTPARWASTKRPFRACLASPTPRSSGGRRSPQDPLPASSRRRRSSSTAGGSRRLSRGPPKYRYALAIEREHLSKAGSN
jgi:hypothetical protein